MIKAEELRQLYVDEGLTGHEIAERYGVCAQTAYNWLRQAGIPVRRKGTYERVPGWEPPYPKIELGADMLRWMYWEAELSLADMADWLGVGVNTVKRRMQEHGIPRRTKREQVLLRLRRGDAPSSEPRNSQRGWYTRADGDRAYYHSSWEYKRFGQLDAMGVQWEAHPSIRIPYIYAGQECIYLPDILVIEGGRIRLEEIKPEWRVEQLEQTRTKLRAAQSYCERKGWEFHLLVSAELERKEVPGQ